MENVKCILVDLQNKYIIIKSFFFFFFKNKKKLNWKKMSWQLYVDQNLLGTKKIENAAICGLDGTIWAKSKGFNV